MDHCRNYSQDAFKTDPETIFGKDCVDQLNSKELLNGDIEESKSICHKALRMAVQRERLELWWDFHKEDMVMTVYRFVKRNLRNENNAMHITQILLELLDPRWKDSATSL